MKNECDVMNFGYVFGARLHITQKNFLGDWNNSCTVIGKKVNNMASRVKGLVCLWHHEHGRTYRTHDFGRGGRSRVLVSWRSTRDATSRRRVPWLATPCYLLSFPIASIFFFFKNDIFINVKKIWKNSHRF